MTMTCVIVFLIAIAYWNRKRRIVKSALDGLFDLFLRCLSCLSGPFRYFRGNPGDEDPIEMQERLRRELDDSMNYQLRPYSVGPFSVSSHSSEDLFDDTEFDSANRSSIIRNENYQQPVNYGSTENT